MSPCRSPSTPRHLRYRQTGGTTCTNARTHTLAHTHTHPQSRHVLFLLMIFHAGFFCVVFFPYSGSLQGEGRTRAVQCRRLQRLPSLLLLLDIAAPRVSTASHEGQRDTTEGGSCAKGFLRVNERQEWPKKCCHNPLFFFLSQGLVILRKLVTRNSSSAELLPTEFLMCCDTGSPSTPRWVCNPDNLRFFDRPFVTADSQWFYHTRLKMRNHTQFLVNKVINYQKVQHKNSLYEIVYNKKN